MSPIADGPATDLDHLHFTLRPEPLIDPGELRKYYRAQVNEVRGEDSVERLSQELQRAYRALPFKAFLMGHRGVGKSTEVSRLLQSVKDQYAGVRLSIAKELNPASFKVFDVLILMLARLAEKADEMNAIPSDAIVNGRLVSEIEQWFSPELIKSTRTDATGAGVEVGVKTPWSSLLGIFASAKAEIKYTADRKSETVEYRVRRLTELVDLCNRLIDACNQSLLDQSGKEWILVVEDLDKAGISSQQLQELFIQYGTVFQSLRVNMILTIPVWLAYSAEADRLPFELHMIYDTPVYDRQHEPHEKGQAALQAVLEARVSPALFAEGQMTRLIVASGGNLWDLFALVLDAGGGARLGTAKVIGPDESTAAINKMRRDYRMRLGQSPYDSNQIPYSAKVSRLLAVYNGATDSNVPDPILYSLLRGRAVQEFNGTGWFGVHPLVVDILKDARHLKPQDPGGTG